jgi:hypothetical protein
MCVQTALNAATVPTDGRARVIGLPAWVAEIEPPTGIADSLASAPAGATAEDAGRGAGDGAAAARLEAGGVCGGCVCGSTCGVECGVVAGDATWTAVDGVGSGALGDVLLDVLLDDAAPGARVLAASGVAPVPHPVKVSTAMPANPAPPPRTARRLTSACSDMVVPPV